MKEQTKIPKHKLGRAARLAGTGAKIGVNYLKYAAKKTITGNDDKTDFHQQTAADSYKAFSELKGGPLKLAQMLSLDRNMIPEQYVDEFSKAQYSAPPLSYPLVVKSFLNDIGKRPNELFDNFDQKATAGASIGQVHKASKDHNDYAVKVQYPGVADSLKSDLAIVKPLAMRLFQLDAASIDPYLGEVEARLLEETDYLLELKRSCELAEKSSHIENIRFPKFYSELSSKRILTMEWVHGQLLDQYAEDESHSQEEKTKIAQALWDFYHHQIHDLRVFHADPHPGNFKVHHKELWVLDFGCVKALPNDFYKLYFELMNPETFQNDTRFTEVLEKIGLLLPTDSPADRDLLKKVFLESVELLSRPFIHGSFDFSDKTYFEEKSSMISVSDAGSIPKSKSSTPLVAIPMPSTSIAPTSGSTT